MASPVWRSSWTRWAAALGFALGGFFDGVLLHQILQWHHLLSLAAAVSDLRLQVLWDGYFHGLMYVIAVAALWGLWRAQRRGEDLEGRVLAGTLLTGFGAWHVIDAVASHWLLGLHRVNLQSPNPLMWDLIWLGAFGLLPLAAGALLVRRGGGGRPGRRASVTALGALIGLIGIAGAWALRPPAEQPFTTVVFAPGVEPRQALAAVADADARLVWTDAGLGVVVVEADAAERWRFYRRGALLVSGAGLPAGCFAWSRA